MRINHNISALKANNQLYKTNKRLDKSLQRLSSGFRINSAADDAAGLAISEKMKTQIAGLNQASRNAADGISVIQTAEGALVEVEAMLQRMRELSVQAANGVYVEQDREAIQDEINQLTEEIDRISKDTEFNTKPLLDGTINEANPMVIQIGANEGQTVEISIDATNSTALGIGGVSLKTESGAGTAITTFDNAIQKVSEIRAKLGAYQNRFEHSILNLDTTSENLTEALSRISDTNMASEMAEFTQNNVLSQAGISMLSQANQRPQSILSLLQS